jgi:hypothetical protein
MTGISRAPASRKRKVVSRGLVLPQSITPSPIWS